MKKECACGCGQATSGGEYRPGHDQKLRAQLERRVGGLSGLARLVDTVERYLDGSVSLDVLGRRLHELIAKARETSPSRKSARGRTA
jgi:hypothetical protein